MIKPKFSLFIKLSKNVQFSVMVHENDLISICAHYRLLRLVERIINLNTLVLTKLLGTMF